jgi:hypothetical protein
MLLTERYETAINSGNLVVSERTTYSPTDILAGAAFATKESPLGAALLRWFAGDRRSLTEISEIATKMLIGKAWHTSKLTLAKPTAERVLGDVLVWYWVAACAFCQGRGYLLIPGAPVLSGTVCNACGGRGRQTLKVDFGRHKDLAMWLANEFQREHSLAVSRMRLAVEAR